MSPVVHFMDTLKAKQHIVDQIASAAGAEVAYAWAQSLRELVDAELLSSQIKTSNNN